MAQNANNANTAKERLPPTMSPPSGIFYHSSGIIITGGNFVVNNGVIFDESVYTGSGQDVGSPFRRQYMPNQFTPHANQFTPHVPRCSSMHCINTPGQCLCATCHAAVCSCPACRPGNTICRQCHSRTPEKSSPLTAGAGVRDTARDGNETVAPCPPEVTSTSTQCRRGSEERATEYNVGAESGTGNECPGTSAEANSRRNFNRSWCGCSVLL